MLKAWRLGVQANADDKDHVLFDGAAIAGSPYTAMTLEFAQGLTNIFEAVAPGLCQRAA